MQSFLKATFKSMRRITLLSQMSTNDKYIYIYILCSVCIYIYIWSFSRSVKGSKIVTISEWMWKIV